MPQTLLAILSMMVATLFAFNQHRHALSARLKMISQDMEMRATSVAVEHVEHIGSLAFDESTVIDPVKSVDELHTMDVVSVYQDPVESADDISDFHETTIEMVRMKDTTAILFDVSTQIEYVDSATLSPSTVPTKLKKATVIVKPTNSSVGKTVQVTEIITCGSKCDW